jgi:DNA-binding response OmpR family regulator
MRFATLIHKRQLRDRVRDALIAVGIEVHEFSAVHLLLADPGKQAFAAILVQDDEAGGGPWLRTLHKHVDEAIALIAIGRGGTADMSRALLNGADDYVHKDDDAAHLVHRALARVSTKLQRSQPRTWRLGPYVLDVPKSVLLSADVEVHLSPRELTLARVLIENHGRIVALERLCQDLCARIDDAARRAVKQHAHMLRKKCDIVAGTNPQRLRVKAAYGQGYRITL